MTRWLAGESAGQCGPCAFGLPAIASAVEDLAAGGRPRESLAALGRWLPMVDKRGGCKLPDGVVRFVSSGLQVFADHVAEHQRHACRSRGCRARPAGARTPGAVAMTFRLVLDPIACDGHGICAELFPEGIRLDDWGYPILVAGDVPPAWRAHARRAADRVPEAGAHDRPWRPAVAPGRACDRPARSCAGGRGGAHRAVAAGRRGPPPLRRDPRGAVRPDRASRTAPRSQSGPARRAPSPGELASSLRPSCGPCGGGTPRGSRGPSSRRRRRRRPWRRCRRCGRSSTRRRSRAAAHAASRP